MEYISKKTIKLLNIKPRPRTWLGPFYDHKTGKKYYIRKRDMGYFQLREKYPKAFHRLLPPSHVFQPSHHLAKSLEEIESYETLLSGCLIGIIAFIVTFYTLLIIATWVS